MFALRKALGAISPLIDIFRQSANDYSGFSASAQPGFSGWMRLQPMAATAASTEATSWSSVGGHHQSSVPPTTHSFQSDYSRKNISPNRSRPRDLGPARLPPRPASSETFSRGSAEGRRPVQKTIELRAKLRDVFPDNIDQIECVLRDHPLDEDVSKLSSWLIGMLEDL